MPSQMATSLLPPVARSSAGVGQLTQFQHQHRLVSSAACMQACMPPAKQGVGEACVRACAWGAAAGEVVGAGWWRVSAAGSPEEDPLLRPDGFLNE
mmetsp:Transcript_96595/g.211201  ORF Transcript_96595/g.211201 Transcript_96595/m.211201 type:complete len:96 (+) Transcript_96595:91-378(+)